MCWVYLYKVLAATVKNWYTEEWKAKGHSGNFHNTPKRKGKPPAVEFRTHLPLTRGKTHSATYIPEAKGEYFEEDTSPKVEMNVLWPPGLEAITMYVLDSEGQELTDGTSNRAPPRH